MTKQEFEEIEEKVFDISVPIRDSTAFVLALKYVKEHSKKEYRSLILTEAEEAGIDY